jgi:putative YhbY family RNA-binding protein
MASTLTNKERAHLKARAHALEPVVHVGGAGVTDAVVAELERALAAHELLKVKIGGDDRAARVAIGDDLCTRTQATVVHRVGKVVILWRPQPELEAAAKKGPEVSDRPRGRAPAPRAR